MRRLPTGRRLQLGEKVVSFLLNEREQLAMDGREVLVGKGYVGDRDALLFVLMERDYSPLTVANICIKCINWKKKRGCSTPTFETEPFSTPLEVYIAYMFQQAAAIN